MPASQCSDPGFDQLMPSRPPRNQAAAPAENGLAQECSGCGRATTKIARYFQIVVTTFDDMPGLENTTYKSYLCRNGTMLERVRANHRTREELSADEWNTWLEGKRRPGKKTSHMAA